MDSPEQAEISPTDAPKPVSRLEAVKNGVEMFSKIILGLAAACFVCGIIVVNLYLREFGVASFSLFRVSYITAGVWTFSPVGFAALLVGTFLLVYFKDQITGEQVLPDEQDQPPSGWKKWEKIAKKLSNALIAMFVSLFVVGIIFFALRIPMAWKWLGAITLGAFTGLFVIATLVVFFQRSTNREKLLGAAGAFSCLAVFLCYLILLAPSLYREIPASVGGGAGMPVVFVVSTDKQELVKAAGLTFAEPMRTDQVTLLLQTDKEFVVLAGDPKAAITLSADLVSAIRHTSPK